jgi:peptidoglycan/xylan/chitin deacetylase (PgdA/CDA1 family)
MRRLFGVGFSLAAIAIVSLSGTGSSVHASDTVPPDTVPTTLAPESSTSTTTTTNAPQQALRPKDIIKVSKIRTRDRVVFITIDDGATVSRELARVIDRYQVPITTFAMPGMLWRARTWYRARENMSFQNHTNTHAHMTTISPKNQAIELCHASKMIRRMFGERPTLYRPPRGSWSEKNRIAMAKCGLKYAVMWSVVIQNSVPDNIRFTKGDIILFHYVQSLPDVLPQVLKKLEEQGLEPALLVDYLT